ncbi:MobA/MobL family protein [Stenotrophomonas sp.]|uniref:MobA/MobL family protein n=1 Tax=Stenotrophomonas sp. TaxID=69392 RepID=UPI0028A978F4|nr:MobA/MobL family protein [Stenotrophomonas sp.]
MKIFHLQLRTGAKGKAVGHSDYIRREGRYRSREDLVDVGCGNLPFWAKGNARAFWAAADAYERMNGAAYREFIIALPNELVGSGSRDLVHDLICYLAGTKPYQFAVHAPEASLEGGINLHLHLMISDRMPDGIDRPASQMFRRYNPDRPEAGGRRKDACGRTNEQVSENVIESRYMVAKIINEHLERNGIAERVDHRTLKEQGIERRAERHLGAFRIRGMSGDERLAYVTARQAMRGRGEL